MKIEARAFHSTKRGVHFMRSPCMRTYITTTINKNK